MRIEYLKSTDRTFRLGGRATERSEAISSFCRGLLRRPDSIGTSRNDSLEHDFKFLNSLKIQKIIISFLTFITLGMGSPVKGDNRMSCKLEVETLADRCRFTLVVTNNLNSELILQFPTSHQYDFIVKSSDGQPRLVWQWSQGMMFAQMFTSLILGPNEEKKFTEEYNLPIGEYTAQGILTTTPNKIYTEWVSFTVKTAEIPVLRGKVTKILDKFYFLARNSIAYLIENPSEEIQSLQNKTIEITSYKTEPIPGTVDKKIIIEEYTEDTNAEY